MQCVGKGIRFDCEGWQFLSGLCTFSSIYPSICVRCVPTHLSTYGVIRIEVGGDGEGRWDINGLGLDVITKIEE